MKVWATRIALVAIGIILAVLLAWTLWHSYVLSARWHLRGGIVRATFRSSPGSSGKDVTVTDRASLERLREWIITAESPGIDSHPIANCRLDITMDDGRHLSMAISSVDAGSVDYVILKWGTSTRIGDAAVFREHCRSSPPSTSPCVADP